MTPETIVEYTVKIVKSDKNLYYYQLSIQPGGPKPVSTKGTDQDGNEVTMTTETNPPTTKGGQALGIGQAMILANDVVFVAIEDAGMVK